MKFVSVGPARPLFYKQCVDEAHERRKKFSVILEKKQEIT